MAVVNALPSMEPSSSLVTIPTAIPTKPYVTSEPDSVNKFSKISMLNFPPSSLIVPNPSTHIHQEININLMYGSSPNMYGKLRLLI